MNTVYRWTAAIACIPLAIAALALGLAITVRDLWRLRAK